MRHSLASADAPPPAAYPVRKEYIPQMSLWIAQHQELYQSLLQTQVDSLRIPCEVFLDQRANTADELGMGVEQWQVQQMATEFTILLVRTKRRRTLLEPTFQNEEGSCRGLHRGARRRRLARTLARSPLKVWGVYSRGGRSSAAWPECWCRFGTRSARTA